MKVMLYGSLQRWSAGVKCERRNGRDVGWSGIVTRTMTPDL